MRATTCAISVAAMSWGRGPKSTHRRAPHGQRRLHPFHLCGAPFGMRLIHLHAGHVHVPDHLLVRGLRPRGGHTLAALHGLEIDRTEIGSALITDAPALILHQLSDRLCGELAAGHEGALPFRALPVACCTAQPCDGLVRPGPRPMRAVAFWNQ